MHKMLTFFAAPVTAIFYRPVYREAAKSSAARGVLYTLYLAGISAFLIMMLFSSKVVPQADAFVEWTKTSMPVLLWTPAGVSLENGKTSAEMVHPKYGKLAMFDMTKTTVTEADLGTAFVFVTATKVFTKQTRGKLEERDITGAAMRQGQQLPPKVRIGGDIVGKLYQNIMKMLVPIGAFLVFLFAYLLMMAGNLLYSLIGMLFNRMRKEKLDYGAIFNLTCFATSVSLTLTWVKVLTPLDALKWPFAVNVLINLLFMFFAFKTTDTEAKAA